MFQIKHTKNIKQTTYLSTELTKTLLMGNYLQPNIPNVNDRRSQDFSSSEGKETLGLTLLLQYPGPRFFVFHSDTISVNIMEGCKINAKLCEAI